MAKYSNQFTVNINEIARIIFTDVVTFGDETKVHFVEEIAMYPEALKGLADLIYQSLDHHEKQKNQNMKEAN